MWNLNDINPPESEAVQAEREIVEAIVQNDSLTMGDARAHDREIEALEAAFAAKTARRVSPYDEREDIGCGGCDNGEHCGACDCCPAVQIAPCRFKRLHAGGWGIIGPAEAVVEGQAVTVEKRDGTHDVVTVGKVLWTGNGQSIARINRSPRAARPDRGGAFNNRARS